MEPLHVAHGLALRWGALQRTQLHQQLTVHRSIHSQTRSVYRTSSRDVPTEKLPAGLQELWTYLEKLFGVTFTLREYQLLPTESSFQQSIAEVQTHEFSLEGTFATRDGEYIQFQLHIQQISARIFNVAVNVQHPVDTPNAQLNLSVNAIALQLQSFSFQIRSTLPLRKFFIPFTDLDGATMAFDRNQDGKIDLRSEISTPPSIALQRQLVTSEAANSTENADAPTFVDTKV